MSHLFFLLWVFFFNFTIQSQIFAYKTTDNEDPHDCNPARRIMDTLYNYNADLMSIFNSESLNWIKHIQVLQTFLKPKLFVDILIKYLRKNLMINIHFERMKYCHMNGCVGQVFKRFLALTTYVRKTLICLRLFYLSEISSLNMFNYVLQCICILSVNLRGKTVRTKNLKDQNYENSFYGQFETFHCQQTILDLQQWLRCQLIYFHQKQPITFARMFGKDQNGSFYTSIDQMWEVQINSQKPTYKVVDPVGSLKNWYQKANEFWKKSDATYNGVLSGYGTLSQVDIKGSQKFLNSLKIDYPRLKFNSVLDCGAGIGRVSKELFCRYFSKVDIIDQCENYILKAKQILKGLNIRHFYCKGLQEFNYEQKYDIVWIQWVLSQLTDKDAIEFLIKTKLALNEGGMIVMKQNHTQRGFLVDKTDYSVTRSSQMYKNLIQQAGLTIVKQQIQQNWSKDLYDVKMYALI